MKLKFTRTHKIILTVIALIVFSSIIIIQFGESQIRGSVFWRRISGSLNPIIGTNSVGRSGARISKFWGDDADFTATTIGTLTLGAATISATDPSLILDVTTVGDTDFWIGVQDDAGGDDNDKFHIGDGTTPGTNPFLTIDTDGNVGIGTTNPNAQLRINRSISVNSGLLVYANNYTHTTNFYDLVSVQSYHTAASGDGGIRGVVSDIYGYNNTTSGTIEGFKTTVGTLVGGTIGTVIGFHSKLVASGTTNVTSGYGVSSHATPSTGTWSTLYGIYATASGGSTNWAGYFDDGNVYMKGNVGIGTTGPLTKLHLDDDGAILAQGTYNSGWTEPDLGAGTRMIWYPRKAAFRAGYVTGTEWDNANIGSLSVATGLNTTASGQASVAMGYNSTANAAGGYSVAMGANSTASGQTSFAMGATTTASGTNSVAMGGTTIASADESFAMGNVTTASGNFSVAMGAYSSAAGIASFAMGYDSDVTGDYASAFGQDIDVSGANSFGIALSNQNGATITAANTMAIMGGNVGIGTTAPGAPLHVLHTGGGPSGDIVKFEGDTNEETYINYSGDFYVIGSDSTFITVRRPNNTYNVGYAIGTVGESDSWDISVSLNTTDLRFLNIAGGQVKSVIIKSATGNVGIGVMGPTSRLDVVGDIEVGSANAFYYGDPTTDATWRTVRDGTKLSFQRRETGAYVEKGFFDTSFHADKIYVGNIELSDSDGNLQANGKNVQGEQVGGGGESLWQRIGIELSPLTVGDDVNLGTGNLLLGDAEIEHKNRTHDPVYLSGQTGLNDLTFSGTYSLTGNAVFQVRIASTGTPDNFEWRKGTSGTWTGPVVMTGNAQLMQDGISSNWGATTGHTLDNEWEGNVGHEIHISEPTHVLGDLTADGDIVVAGTLRSLSPLRIQEGINILCDKSTDRAKIITSCNAFDFGIDGVDKVTFAGDGTVEVSAANYETLVTSDNDIPNRKFVMDEIGLLVTGISSVFGRTGDVVAVTNDYTWAQIDRTVSDLADITTKSHTSLTDKGTNTHAQIDTHLSAAAPHSGHVNNTGSEIIAGAKTFTTPIFVTVGTDPPYIGARYSSGRWLAFDDGTDLFGLYNFAGDPDGSVAADIGSLGINTSAGELYVKTTDTVSTGWNKFVTDNELINQTTGWLEGAQVTINSGDDTLIDISPGSVQIVTGTDNPVATIISWDAQTALDPALATRSTWVGVRDDGFGVAEFVFDTEFDATERRTIAILGRIWNNAGTQPIITSIGDYERPAWGLLTAFQDFILEYGSWNISGNTYSANGVNLLLDKSTGKSFRYHAEDVVGQENVHTDAAQSPRTSYAYHLQGIGTTTTETDIEPDYYDNAGVKAALANNKWTVQEVWFFPVSGTCHVLYGQAIYSSKTEAIAAISTETKVRNTGILSGAILRAYLVLEKGAIDLTDTAKAEIRDAGGEGGAGGGGSVLWTKIGTNLSPTALGDDVLLNTGTTLSIVDMTTGSIPFIGESGLLSQDNSNLVWDDTNKRLGIGTSDPKSAFHIKGDAPGTVGSHPAGQLIIQNPTVSVWANAVITGYSSDVNGDPSQQLWYFGSVSGSNSDITILNRRSSKLHLGTNSTTMMSILPDGSIVTTNDIGAKLILGRMDNVYEGGEINFTGAASYDSWKQDSYQNTMRFFTDSSNYNEILMTNIGAGSVNLSVDGYTKLGSNAPRIKIRKYTGTTASTEGGNTEITHGLTASKILSVDVTVQYAGGGFIPVAYTQDAGYQANVSWDADHIHVHNHATNSANILNDPFVILVTYEE